MVDNKGESEQTTNQNSMYELRFNGLSDGSIPIGQVQYSLSIVPVKGCAFLFLRVGTIQFYLFMQLK